MCVYSQKSLFTLNFMTARKIWLHLLIDKPRNINIYFITFTTVLFLCILVTPLAISIRSLLYASIF